MKIQFNKLIVENKFSSDYGDVINVAHLVTSNTDGSTFLNKEVEFDYNNFSFEEKKIVDDFINLLNSNG